MSFSRYLEYKHSGVTWLGEIPEHWELKPLWTLFRRMKRTGFGDEQLLSIYRDYGVVPKASRDDNFNKPSDDLSEYQLVVPGDLAVNKMKAWQGSVAISEYRGIVSPAYFIYEPLHISNSRYFHYLMRSMGYTAGYLSISKGIRPNQWDLEPQLHSRMPVVVPTSAEQALIATFLDHETAKIDALVAEQRNLIELLREKRQAVISYAVTKGLNPNATTKPSGIQWLGDVPAHWDILRGSLIGALFGSDQVPEESVSEEGDLPFIKVGSLSSDTFAIESWDWFVDRAVADQFSPRSGYVVFPKRGAAIFTNKVNIVERPSLIDPNLMGWEVGNRATAKFIAYTLKCRKLGELADVSTVPQINNKHIAPERFPVPPLDEQNAIVAFIEAVNITLDAFSAEALRAIELLQERRTALIFSAVTGKIDVHRLAPVKAEAA